MQIHPSRLRPLRAGIVVKAYERPEEVGSLVLPRSYAVDRSWTIWEVVRASEKAQAVMGMELSEGDILRTKVVTAVDSGLVDERDGRRLFFQTPDVVMHVTPCTW